MRIGAAARQEAVDLMREFVVLGVRAGLAANAQRVPLLEQRATDLLLDDLSWCGHRVLPVGVSVGLRRIRALTRPQGRGAIYEIPPWGRSPFTVTRLPLRSCGQ